MATEAKRQKLKQMLNKHQCMLQDLCDEKGYTVRHLNDYQTRINNVLDVYPTRLKYFYLPKKVWGQFTESTMEQDIIKLLNK